jgi:Ca-activated chloride channel family protein
MRSFKSDSNQAPSGFFAAAPPAQVALGKAGNVMAYDKLGNANYVANMRQIGSKTFFRRDNRWVDSSVTPEEEAKATVLEQFGDDYFRLARAQTPEQNQYLAMPEELVVRLGGNIYRIQQAKQ